MKRSDLARFATQHLLPRLGEEYVHYKGGDLIRMRGPFVQANIVNISKSGNWIEVFPTLFVVGANPIQDETIHQTVSLNVDDPHRWSFERPDLDRKFSELLVAQIEKRSLISFVSPLTDDAIDYALRKGRSQNTHWAAFHFLAFFNMVRGAPTAREDLLRAKNIFCRVNEINQKSKLNGPPIRDWEVTWLKHLEEQERRLDLEDCIALCRADAEAHAEHLKLPAIEWPAKWPTAVPPWPKKSQGLMRKILGNF